MFLGNSWFGKMPSSVILKKPITGQPLMVTKPANNYVIRRIKA